MKKQMRTAAVTAAVAVWLGTAVSVSALALELVPVGRAIGIEVDVDGVLVEQRSGVDTDKGEVFPAKAAGIKEGDVIVGVNGEDIDDLEDFAQEIKGLDGSPLRLELLREGKTVTVELTPAKSVDGEYRLGLWLRDKVAGIGTVTYYDPKSGEYGALGHGINDPESGTLIPIDGGVTYDASVVDVVRGQSGDPGELTGSFDTGAVFGSVGENTVYGIFGSCGAVDGAVTPLETAAPGEVKVGAAQIISTVDGCEPKTYDIHIDKVQRKGGEERYQLTVTDPNLLERTGGVVCGMSGSPIIQDGKLVGAVTHVLVNDPTRGYGIFIENMLDAAG